MKFCVDERFCRVDVKREEKGCECIATRCVSTANGMQVVTDVIRSKAVFMLLRNSV